MELGLAERVAVGALGGGGGGGAVSFFLQPLATANKTSTPRTTIRILLLLFTSCPPKNNATQYKAYLKLQLGWLLRPWRVSCCKCVPSASTLHICSVPLRLDWNTMCRPSGDHDGKSL